MFQRATAPALVLALSLALAACGGSDGDEATATPAPAQTATATPAATAAAPTATATPEATTTATSTAATQEATATPRAEPTPSATAAAQTATATATPQAAATPAEAASGGAPDLVEHLRERTMQMWAVYNTYDVDALGTFYEESYWQEEEDEVRANLRPFRTFGAKIDPEETSPPTEIAPGKWETRHDASFPFGSVKMIFIWEEFDGEWLLTYAEPE